jgi:two-component system, NarL family, response regulator YdfI
MAHKILVVDDNAHVRRGIRASIEQREGWVVCGEAENGKIAVVMVGTHSPHLVILDLSMPGMNGLEAAREISKVAPGIPMIMFTTPTTPYVK